MTDSLSCPRRGSRQGSTHTDPAPITTGSSHLPSSPSSSMRQAASTSRTCGRYAVGPAGRSRTPTPTPARPQTTRRRSNNRTAGWPAPTLQGWPV